MGRRTPFSRPSSLDLGPSSDQRPAMSGRGSPRPDSQNNPGSKLTNHRKPTFFPDEIRSWASSGRLT